MLLFCCRVSYIYFQNMVREFTDRSRRVLEHVFHRLKYLKIIILFSKTTTRVFFKKSQEKKSQEILTPTHTHTHTLTPHTHHVRTPRSEAHQERLWRSPREGRSRAKKAAAMPDTSTTRRPRASARSLARNARPRRAPERAERARPHPWKSGSVSDFFFFFFDAGGEARARRQDRGHVRAQVPE